MITNQDIKKIYEWAKKTHFPLKKAPTAEGYKRIQIPLRIPDRNHCFMIWDNKKILWKEGVSQVYPVMDVTHEGYNLSTKPMEFVMIDVKLDTIVENETYSQ